MASHWVIIVSASDQETANTITGEQTFTVGLSATGEDPVTHYWSGLSESRKDLLYSQLSTLDSFYMSQQGRFDSSLPNRYEILSSQNLKTMVGGPPPWE
tara:strand:+ start:526 stop:822 length:297 start_codon:yes stop_codon:yes gene_type:complete